MNYVAAVSPLAEPTIQRHTISELFKDSVKASISGVSTFYIPPKELLPLTAAGKKLILDLNTDKAAVQVKTYPPAAVLSPVDGPAGIWCVRKISD